MNIGSRSVPQLVLKASLSAVFAAAFVVSVILPARAQNWDGAGNGGGASPPPPPPTQHGVCVANCGAPPVPGSSTSYRPSSGGGFSGPSSAQMMNGVMQGYWNANTTMGTNIGTANERAAMQDANAEVVRRKAALAASWASEQNKPCPLDTNGMPECGAPAGAPKQSADGKALQQKYDPSAVPVPPSPPQAGSQPAASKYWHQYWDQSGSAEEVGEKMGQQLSGGGAAAGLVVGGMAAGPEGAAHGAEIGHAAGEGVAEPMRQWGHAIDQTNLSNELKLQQQRDNFQRCGNYDKCE